MISLIYRLGQNSEINFVRFLVQMRTRKFASEIYWPLVVGKLLKERFVWTILHCCYRPEAFTTNREDWFSRQKINTNEKTTQFEWQKVGNENVNVALFFFHFKRQLLMSSRRLCSTQCVFHKGFIEISLGYSRDFLHLI